MPFSSEGLQPGIGLALAGGGFRATLFHCGTLWRLNELGYLQKLDRVSSVSAGSITAGVDVMKVLHHGSRSKITATKFLDRVAVTTDYVHAGTESTGTLIPT